MASFPDEPSSSASYEPRLLTRRDRSLPAGSEPPAVLEPAPRPVPRKASRFTVRGIAVTFGVLAVLVLLTAVTVAVFLRRDMRAALPQLDGEIHIAGLTAPVTITRDPQGVPSIKAASLDDVLFAQGYVTASDRLWQMDMLRRHASGNLAELLGSNLIAHDRMQRTLRIGAAADRAIAMLPPDQLHQLTAYANGVNGLIDHCIRTGTLPVEFHVLHYSPAPWTPRDTILVSLAMFQDLSTEFPTKIRREALAAHLPANLLADLYPTTSWRDHPPTQPQPDLTAPVDEIEQIPLDSTQSRLAPSATPAEILALARQFPDQRNPEARSGSNNWAVAGSRSASGLPLVSNDMHLGLNAPDIWYEAALHTPTLDVTGFTLPGAPFVIVGRNQHVAWGFTAMLADTQDVRIEHLRGSGDQTEFERPDGSWAAVGHHPEHIVVRGSGAVDLDVLTTTEILPAPTLEARTPGVTELETPIISALLPSEHRALSLAWTPYDPANIRSPFLAVDTASDGASLVAALASFGGPSLNLVYADDHNHIGYHGIGSVPIRGPATHHPRITQTVIPTDGASAGAVPSNSMPSNSMPSNSMPTDEGTGAGEPDLPPPGTAGRDNANTPPVLVPTVPVLDYTVGSPISPVPVDALDASQIWSGYIPYAQLPAIVDPPNGVLATANARITPDKYAYAIANDWASPYRVERIYKRLAGRGNLTPADMLALENDTHSEIDLLLAQKLVYALDHISATARQQDPSLTKDSARLRQAADILRTWKGEVGANSVAAAIAGAARGKLLGLLLVPQIAAHDRFGEKTGFGQKPGSKAQPHPDELVSLYTWGEQSVALENLLEHTPQRWLSADFPTWNDLLAAALEHGLVEWKAPGDLSTWRYGATHAIAIEHPLFSMIPGADHILGTPSGTGPHANGGNSNTIHANAPHFGPSERFTADLGHPEATTANITTGESGDPASAHYLDQFQPWLRGTTFTLPLTSPAVAHTLTLLP